MPILNNALAGAAGGGAADFKIERSLRFNRDDDAHLSRTFAAGNRKTWTWSGWIKLGREQTGGSSNRYTLFECTNNFGASGNPYGILNIVSGFLGFGEASGGAYTTAQFRDHSAWYHVVAAMDTTQSTAADRLKLYVNGVQYTHTGYTFGLNADTAINQSGIQHNIGREENSDIFEADLLMAEVHFVDGLQLNCTEFGEFDDNGVWQPIEYTGNYNSSAVAGTSYSSATGAKSLYNTTNDGQTLGSGYSTGAIPNTTKLIIPGFNLTEGGGTSGSGQSISNNGVTTVTSNTKYYGTALQFGTAPQQGNNASNSFSFSQNLGLSGADFFTFEAWVYPRSGHGHDFVIIFEGDWNNNNGLMFYLNSSRYPALTLGNGSFQSFYSSQQVPFDKWTHVACVNLNNTISFYVNGNKDTASGTRTKNYSLGNNHRLVGAYRDSNHTAGPRNPFYGYMTDIRVTSDSRYTSSFTVPGGGAIPGGANGFHLDFSDNSSNAALGTDSSGNSNTWTVNNISSGAAVANNGFDVLTYTGTGSARTVSGLNFQPDFLWFKSRTGTDWHALVDTVRGKTKVLFSNASNAEETRTEGVSSFNSGGFSLGDYAPMNKLNDDLVAWCWKANGTAVSNTDGSITSSVSANSAYGFSIISYTGNNTAGATIGHGLSTAPDLVIYKNRDRSESWGIYARPVGATKSLYFNGSAALTATSGTANMYNSTDPSSSVLTVGGAPHLNANNEDIIAYAWSSIPGFSKISTYAGTGSSHTVTCGFRPAYVIVKCTTSGSTNWHVFDRLRGSERLVANLNSNQGSPAAYAPTFTDTGFTVANVSDTHTNASGQTYLFAAFADGDSSGIDSLIDTPTDYEASSGNNGGNYCTLNPLHRSSQVALTNSNLDVSTSSTSNKCKVFGTIGVSSGKWYYEVTIGSNYRGAFGWATDPNSNLEQQPGDSGGDIALTFDGNKLNSGSYSGGFGTAYSSGMVVGVRVDADTGEVGFSQNGTDKGTAYTVGPDKTYWPIVGDASSGGTFNGSVNFGQRPFAYTPPTGYKALCTTNLDTPLIADPSTAFDTKVWNGTGTARSITGYSFSPDFVWGKARSDTNSHWLMDTVRGAGNRLISNDTRAEDTPSGVLTSFNSDGFSIGTNTESNGSGRSYVGWAWDGGDLVTISGSTDYDQSQTWTSVLTSSTGFRSSEPATNAFDGSTSTICSAVGSGLITFAPTGTFPSSSAIRIYLQGSGSQTVTVNGGASQTITGNSWQTVNFTNSSTSSFTLTIQASGGTDSGLRALEIGGKLLIDPGVIPAGSLNSSVYNTSENWVSTGTTTGTAYNSSYSFSPLFDGDLTGLGPQSSSMTQYVYTFANTQSATANTIIFYSTSNTANVPSSNTGSFYINGTQVTTSNCTRLNNSSPYKYRMDGLTTLSSIGSQQSANMTGIEINGKLLVDSNAHTPPNVPTIGCTVRANPTAGFSIVKWNGTGSSGTVHHGLNAEPGFIVCKKMTGVGNWPVYHLTTGRTKYLYLNSTIEARTYQYFWNNTKPTSSVFTIGNDTDVSHSGETHVAYCISPVAGYSAVGSYTGNSSRNFQHTGFQPRWIMIKTTSITAYPAYTGWAIFDSERQPHNVNVNALWPNNGNVEGTRGNNSTASAPDFGIDILSNGFCLRDNGASEINLNGESYIYLAFAENPFKTARAR